MTKDHVGPKEYRLFLSQVVPMLDADFVLDAGTFEHGQWDLPFEAVLLKLLEEPSKAVSVDMFLAERLAKQAGLVEEGVLSPDTWKMFISQYGTS